MPGLLNLEERANGFKETIEANYPNMKVVQTVNGNLDQAEGAKVTAGMLQATQYEAESSARTPPQE